MNKDQSTENTNCHCKNIPNTARHTPNNKLNTKLSTIYKKPKSNAFFSNICTNHSILLASFYSPWKHHKASSFFMFVGVQKQSSGIKGTRNPMMDEFNYCVNDENVNLKTFVVQLRQNGSTTVPFPYWTNIDMGNDNSRCCFKT